MKIIYRNQISMDGKKSVKKHINLEYWKAKVNLGDYLAYIVYNWMLKFYNLSFDVKTNKTIHLMTIGSLIGSGNYDAVIWGSGIHTIGMMKRIFKNKILVKYDVRAVRGPITKVILKEAGYDVSRAVCGDPAVLMPLVYSGKKDKKYKYSVIRHHSIKHNDIPNNCNEISIETQDYKYFIDEITASECVISSSLHGIILAESYGIPAVFLYDNMSSELMKYYDWYYSTGRLNVKIADSLEDAMDMIPMELPNLKKMQQNLIDSFPYDLWNN